jgi:hypothetical protein
MDSIARGSYLESHREKELPTADFSDEESASQEVRATVGEEVIRCVSEFQAR